VLETRFPDFAPEHTVRHFFIDSDNRLEDAAWRQPQHPYILDYIARLAMQTLKNKRNTRDERDGVPSRFAFAHQRPVARYHIRSAQIWRGLAW
jgi:hypothetical protein